MENMDTYATHFAINAFITGVLYVLMLAACIVLFIKKKSVGTIILLVGALLSILAFFGGNVLNALASRTDNTESIMESSVLMAYFNNFGFFVFGIGLLLFAITDFKRMVRE